MPIFTGNGKTKLAGKKILVPLSHILPCQSPPNSVTWKFLQAVKENLLKFAFFCIEILKSLFICTELTIAEN